MYLQRMDERIHMRSIICLFHSRNRHLEYMSFWIALEPETVTKKMIVKVCCTTNCIV